jgi:hypothetical protein
MKLKIYKIKTIIIIKECNKGRAREGENKE